MTLLNSVDFSLHSYSKIITVLLENGFSVRTVSESMKKNKHASKIAVLRHDVDRKPANAVRMAHLEYMMGVKSTYYFRSVKSSFSPSGMQQIADLGHEVGYHYEDYHLSGYDIELAYQSCAENIKKFREIVDVETISMHGSPLSRFNNMDLWNHRSFKDFDVLDCTLSKDWSDFFIFTDTGRSFASGRTNLRDYVGGKKTVNIKSTSDLVNFISTQNAKQIKISTHPERWDSVPLEWAIQFGKDQAINFCKILLSFSRQAR